MSSTSFRKLNKGVLFYYAATYWKRFLKRQRKITAKAFLGVSLRFCKCGVCYLLRPLKQCMAFSQTAVLQGAVVYLLSGSHLLFPTEHKKHLQPGETWLPGVSPVSRHQIIEGRGRKKYGEIKTHSQMLHCRLMLRTLCKDRREKNAE